jgi:hypothetical protein
MKITLWKSILAGTTVLAIAGTTLAYAQQGPGGRDRAPHWRPSAQDVAAFGDARIAAVHAGLKLTPEQEKNWPAVEAALRDMAKQRSERFTARASADKPKDPIERMGLRADAMAERGTALKKLADAAGPLYKSLDDGQKHRFMVLARLGGPQAGGKHGWRGRHGHDGRGFGAEHHRGRFGGPQGGPQDGQMAPGGGKAAQ